MAKVQFSDVTPPEKRSIRNVPIPHGGRRKSPIVIKPIEKPKIQKLPEIQLEEESFETPQIPVQNPVAPNSSAFLDVKKDGPYEYYYPKNKPAPVPPYINKRGSGKKFWFAGIALVAILAFVFVMMTVFASASVVIKPKYQALDVSMKVISSIEPSSETVKYEVIKFSKTQTASVPASKEEVVEEKAHGKIIIYNNFSSEPQRLIVRTRFETPEGLIYRIPESVAVPGKTIKDGVSVPGSVEVEVFADEAGDKYNIDKSDFTIPGFRNDPERFKGFYARSTTDILGGFVGKRKVVKLEDKQAAFQNIETELKSLLEKELDSKIPDGLVMVPGLVTYQFAELPQKDESSSALIGKEGTANIILFDKKSLSEKIIAQYKASFPDWQNIEAEVNNFSTLKASGKIDGAIVGEKLELDISGNTNMVAKIDENAIKESLAGAPRRDTSKLMDEFAGISGITTTIKPIWKQSFPQNTLKIKVQITSNQ